jgi:hypothetical protein
MRWVSVSGRGDVVADADVEHCNRPRPRSRRASNWRQNKPPPDAQFAARRSNVSSASFFQVALASGCGSPGSRLGSASHDAGIGRSGRVRVIDARCFTTESWKRKRRLRRRAAPTLGSDPRLAGSTPAGAIHAAASTSRRSRAKGCRGRVTGSALIRRHTQVRYLPAPSLDDNWAASEGAGEPLQGSCLHRGRYPSGPLAA